MLSFLRAHWRPLAAGLALLLAFAAGRFATPPKTVTVTQVKTVEHVVTKTVTVQAAAQERIVYRDRTVVKHADGSEEHRDIERTEQDNQTASTTGHETAAAASTATASAVTITPARPAWRVSALAGVDVLHLSHPALQYGAVVERRLVGPLWIGAWGLSSGSGGVALSLEF